MDNKVKIYSLACPKTNQIKYIGKTISDLKDRLMGHSCAPTSYDNKIWFRNLKEHNLIPTIELLEEVDKSNADEAEMFWIEQMKQWGFKLNNKTKTSLIKKSSGIRLSIKLSDENDWVVKAIDKKRKQENRPSRNNVMETILVSELKKYKNK